MIFWEDLQNLQPLNSFPWLIGGDLNVIRRREETTTSNPTNHSMKNFKKFITANNLIDLPLTNNKFTWSNLRTHPILSPIDRFLYNAN